MQTQRRHYQTVTDGCSNHNDKAVVKERVSLLSRSAEEVMDKSRDIRWNHKCKTPAGAARLDLSCSRPGLHANDAASFLMRLLKLTHADSVLDTTVEWGVPIALLHIVSSGSLTTARYDYHS